MGGGGSLFDLAAEEMTVNLEQETSPANNVLEMTDAWHAHHKPFPFLMNIEGKTQSIGFAVQRLLELQPGNASCSLSFTWVHMDPHCISFT